MKISELRKYEQILITDIGSTTTKAIFIKNENDNFVFKDVINFPTTVEKPSEDVKIGVFNAIKEIEKQHNVQILKQDSEPANMRFKDNTLYLTTSSAGGGLQILVIGLTLFDSAGTAARAALGAGGIILETFAIDDKRTILQQMQMMKIMRPDIILMSGGIDHGAISSIIRLAEIIRLSSPKPKYFGNKIPFIFAGNVDVRNFISQMFSDIFELHIVPNLRPTMNTENVLPTRELIHHLFLNNVMEQAPGYSGLKKIMTEDILPTPLGVMKSLNLLNKKHQINSLAVDIGGATTDVFSGINGDYFRTVSGNYGMSYSISNVMKDASFENLAKWIPDSINENYIRNYISDKMLYPTFVPKNEKQKIIENAIARESIRMSFAQHIEMNFKKNQMGFLEKLKLIGQDMNKITDTFYYEKSQEKKKLQKNDFDLVIGMGGIFSHINSSKQALITIIDGFQPEGITEIWIDKYFASPHIGKLAEVNEEVALDFLQNDLMQKLGYHIKPIYQASKKVKILMKVIINDEETLEIYPNKILYLNEEGNKINLKFYPRKGVFLSSSKKSYELNTDLPIMIDTRKEYNFDDENKALNLYSSENEDDLESDFIKFISHSEIKKGDLNLDVELPYDGVILVEKGQQVTPENIIGENLFNPPKIYILTLFNRPRLPLTPENIHDSILVSEGDSIKAGQKLVFIKDLTFSDNFKGNTSTFVSPVRGTIEKIDFDSGTIVMREIQDYSSKMYKIKIAERLGIKPKLIKNYTKREVGDFVYSGEILAKKIIDNKTPVIVEAPSTGSIKKIDRENGILYLQYDKKPHRKNSLIYGKIENVIPKKSARISFKGYEIYGIIGFGKEVSGELLFHNNEFDERIQDKILVIPHKITKEEIRKMIDFKVKGVIVSSINNSDLIDFIGFEVGVALTGNEDLPFSIIITEGFGNFKMDKNLEDFYRNNAQKWCYLNPHTQIRAGVIRPKIVIQDI